MSCDAARPLRPCRALFSVQLYGFPRSRDFSRRLSLTTRLRVCLRAYLRCSGSACSYHAPIFRSAADFPPCRRSRPPTTRCPLVPDFMKSPAHITAMFRSSCNSAAYCRIKQPPLHSSCNPAVLRVVRGISAPRAGERGIFVHIILNYVVLTTEFVWRNAKRTIFVRRSSCNPAALRVMRGILTPARRPGKGVFSFTLFRITLF